MGIRAIHPPSLPSFKIRFGNLSYGLHSSIKKLYLLSKKNICNQRKNLDELLLLNSDKRPVEGTNSNLFIIKEDMIFTPPLSEGPLLGCMRSLVLDHFVVKEVALNLKDIQTAVKNNLIYIPNDNNFHTWYTIELI